MTISSIRAISIIAGSIFSVAFILMIDWFFSLEDEALIMALVAMTSSANSIGIFLKLQGKYGLKTLNPTE